jgi:hypothetical protein
MAKKEESTEFNKELADAVDNPVPPAPPAGDGLNVSDIRACVTIIDIVTKRGAFEGAELADVGQVRNRLEKFLVAATAAQEAQAPATEAPAEDEVEA